MRLELKVLVEAKPGSKAWDLAERLFDFMVSDPDDLFPEIETVEGYDVSGVA